MATALTIAGSDSSGGAGIQADLKTFAAFDVYGVCAVTAVTAQSLVNVNAVYPIPADHVIAQIDAVVDEFAVDAVKTGMLLTVATVEAVAGCLAERGSRVLLVDPVMVATSGRRLLEPDAVSSLKSTLLPMADVVTPNRQEAEVLAGHPIETPSSVRDAARRIHDLGPKAVIVTGGHFGGEKIVDLVFDGREFFEMSGPRIISTSTHGTGCTFGAALTAGLALKRSLSVAARDAKRYVERALRGAPAVGRGHGPLQHLGHNTRG